MSNILLSYSPKNDLSAASYAGSNELSTFPLENMSNSQPNVPYRTTSGSVFGQYIQVDFGSAVPVDFIGLFNTNFLNENVNEWRIRLGSNVNPAVGNLYDSGLVDIFPAGTQADDGLTYTNCFHKFTQVTARYLYINLNLVLVNGNIWTGLNIGRLHASTAFIPDINIAYDWALGFFDDSAQPRSLGGSTYVNPGPKGREVKFALNFNSEDELYNYAFQMDRLIGMSKDVYVNKDIDNLSRYFDYSIYGIQSALSPIINHNYGLFKKRFSVRELL